MDGGAVEHGQRAVGFRSQTVADFGAAEYRPARLRFSDGLSRRKVAGGSK